MIHETVWQRLRENVARGIAYLDREHPGWHKKITRELEMRNCRRCVLGQLMGNFHHYPLVVEDYDWAHNHGFEIMDNFYTSEISDAYSALETIWNEELARRNKETATCPS